MIRHIFNSMRIPLTRAASTDIKEIIKSENGFPPLLKTALSRMAPNLSLKNDALIAVGHLTPTNTMFIRMLIGILELDPKRIFFQPKCYSADNDSYIKMKSLGVHVAESGFLFDPTKDYDSILGPAARETFELGVSRISQMQKKGAENGRLVLMDDGAYLTHPDVIKPILPKIPKNLVTIATELTGNGIMKLNQYLAQPGTSLPIPVIDQARAPIKKIEMDIIVKTILPIFHMKLRKFLSLSPETRPPKILIHGGGLLGKKLRTKLFGVHETKIYDEVPHKSDFSRSEFDIALAWANIHIIAHPMTGISKEQKEKLHHCMIFNTGSGNKVFRIPEILHDYYSDNIPFPSNCHEDVFTKNSVFIANGGYPGNFTDDPRDYNWIDHHLTRMIQLIGIIQAKQFSLENGIVPLNHCLTREAITLWNEFHGIKYND